jgi:hypothetical protein
VIVAFDGRALPRGEALDRIRTSLPDLPCDKATAVTLIRDGKRLETKAVWESGQP